MSHLKTMRPVHTAHASHRSNATADQSLSLEETFARNASRRTFEKGASFQSRASSRATNNHYSMLNHNSMSYTSHNNGLGIVGEEFDTTPGLPQDGVYAPPAAVAGTGGSSRRLQQHSEPPPPPSRGVVPTDNIPNNPSFGRNDAIQEERTFHHPPKPARPSPHQRANVPPLSKLEPQHVEVSAPSRRCLHKPPGPILVTGSTVRQPGDVGSACRSCRMQLWAVKTAIVVRCPQCRTVQSEAVCAASSMQ